jgi:hypothetical protein
VLPRSHHEAEETTPATKPARGPFYKPFLDNTWEHVKFARAPSAWQAVL